MKTSMHNPLDDLIIETFSCGSCKTVFYLQNKTWEDMKKQGLKITCPRCQVIVYNPNRKSKYSRR